MAPASRTNELGTRAALAGAARRRTAAAARRQRRAAGRARGCLARASRRCARPYCLAASVLLAPGASLADGNYGSTHALSNGRLGRVTSVDPRHGTVFAVLVKHGSNTCGYRVDVLVALGAPQRALVLCGAAWLRASVQRPRRATLGDKATQLGGGAYVTHADGSTERDVVRAAPQRAGRALAAGLAPRACAPLLTCASRALHARQPESRLRSAFTSSLDSLALATHFWLLERSIRCARVAAGSLHGSVHLSALAHACCSARLPAPAARTLKWQRRC